MRLVLLLVLSIGLWSLLPAQNVKTLKGPRAKNYKPWLKKLNSNTVHVVLHSEVLKGPECKNRKVWSVPKLDSRPLIIGDRRAYYGVLAKNYKPWKHGRKMVQPVGYSQRL